MNVILTICFRWFMCANKIEQLKYASASLYNQVKFDQELIFNIKVSNKDRFSSLDEDYLKPYNTPNQFTDMLSLLNLDGEMLVKVMKMPNNREVQRRIHLDMMDRLNEDLYKLELPAYMKTEQFYRNLQQFIEKNVCRFLVKYNLIYYKRLFPALPHILPTNSDAIFR